MNTCFRCNERVLTLCSGLCTDCISNKQDYENDMESTQRGGMPPKHDAVNHPKHYTTHPSNIECIEITRHMGFNLGNAIKYIWRADLKHDAIEDLKKAAWYINDEITKREEKK